MKPHFNLVPLPKIGRSAFNLSYEKKLTCDMGELIPIMVQETVPGDVMSLGNQLVIRFQPLVAPVLHEINAYIHYFFVPYRILWDDWEDFITGGEDGTEAPTMPTWNPGGVTTAGSLWDYLEYPTGYTPPVGGRPIDLPKRAYNQIYNDYYRDENLITEIDITTADDVQIRAWEKDYFTSCLPWQQRGTAPALPISGVLDVDPSGDEQPTFYSEGESESVYAYHTTGGGAGWFPTPGAGSAKMAWTDPKLEVDLSGASTFDIADLRLAFQIQRWMERNARAGARYTEFIDAHFGRVAPRDERLDRPEYIGGSKSPVIISEVQQTSSTDETTPQGNLAGHGIAVDARNIGTYRTKEYGILMAILSVMPRTAYQQGINKQWLRLTKYDFYFPEFANLSEQAVTRAEIKTDPVEANNAIVFGYQGRYNEMRGNMSRVAAGMRSTFDYWHLGRQLGTPTLNQTFIQCVPDKRIFADEEEDGLIVNCLNIIKAVRPLPIIPNPGLIDH